MDLKVFKYIPYHINTQFSRCLKYKYKILLLNKYQKYWMQSSRYKDTNENAKAALKAGEDIEEYVQANRVSFTLVL